MARSDRSIPTTHRMLQMSVFNEIRNVNNKADKEKVQNKNPNNKSPGETKVGNLDLTVSSEENVGRFNVAVHNVVHMEVTKGID